MSTPTDPIALWRAISSAGGTDAYIQQQLRERGFLVRRRPTDGMNKRDLEAYKKSLKAEAAERRALRAAAWRAYRASHVVHLGEGVYWNDADTADRWDHPRAAERAAENGLPDLAGPADLAEALGLSVAELRWLAYHRDAARQIHYRRFTIPKRDGTERAIWAPLPRLKAAQRWILQEIVEHLPVHGAAHGFLAGRSVATNARIHADSRLIVKMDVRDFFPTITLPRVKGVFRKAGYREQVATLLALLCTESPREVVEADGQTWYISLGPRCLPQGAPTSPALTNTLCGRLDRRLTGLADSLGWRYTRYADDLTFSVASDRGGDPRLGALLGAVPRIAADEGFAIKPAKTRVIRAGGRHRITGLVVNGDSGPRTPRQLRRQLRAAIHNLEQGRPLPEGESLDRLKGYAAWVHMTQPELGAGFLERLAAIESAAGAGETG